MEDRFWKVSITYPEYIVTDDGEELVVVANVDKTVAKHIVTVHNLFLLSRNNGDRFEDIKTE